MKRFDLILRSDLGNEVQAGQKRTLFTVHLYFVHDIVVEVAPIFFTNVTDVPLLQDYQIEVVVKRTNYFLRVGYLGLKLFRKIAESTV